MHIHALIEARYIDELELSQQWASVTGNMGRIVKVRDARGPTMVNQVTKYLVKGNTLAAWAPDVIMRFILAFEGTRCFGVFGNLHGLRTEFADWFKQVRDSNKGCACGCQTIRFYSETQWLYREIGPEDQHEAPRPPPSDHQLQLLGHVPGFPRD